MGISEFKLIVLLVVVVLLFGPGKVSGLMGDLGKGIRTFKKVMNAPDEPEEPTRAAPASPQDAPIHEDGAGKSSTSETP